MMKLIEVRAFNVKGLPIYQSTFEVDDNMDILEQVHRRLWECVTNHRHPLRDESDIFNILGVDELEVEFV